MLKAPFTRLSAMVALSIMAFGTSAIAQLPERVSGSPSYAVAAHDNRGASFDEGKYGANLDDGKYGANSHDGKFGR